MKRISGLFRSGLSSRFMAAGASSLLFALLVVTGPSLTPSHAQSEETASPPEGRTQGSFDIGDFYTSIRPYSLGNSSPSNTAVSIYSSGGNFFHAPLILPDWKSYAEEVMKACAAIPAAGGDAADQTIDGMPEGIVEVPITIRLEDQDFRVEALDAINRKERSSNELASLGNLLVIPYDLLVIELVLPGVRQEIYSFPFDRLDQIRSAPADSQPVLQPNLGVEASIDVPVALDCLGHTSLIGTVNSGRYNKDRKVLEGRLYQHGDTFDVTRIQADFAAAFSADIRSALDTEESVEVSASGSGGFTINLPIMQISSGGSAEQSVRRLVSREILDEIQSRVMTRRRVECTGACNIALDDLLETALQPIKTEELFVQVVEGQLQLFPKQVEGYFTITDAELEAKFINKLKTAHGSEFGVAGVPVKSNDEQDGSTEHGINTRKFPIPTTGDLLLVAENDFSSETATSVVLRSRNGTALFQHEMIYPFDKYRGFLDAGQKESITLDIDRCIANGQIVMGSPITNSEKSDRSTKPSKTVLVEYTAPAGALLSSYTVKKSGSNAREKWLKVRLHSSDPSYASADPWISVRGFDKAEIDKLRIDGVRGQYECFRGSSAPKRRTCTISATILPKIQPVACKDMLDAR